MSETVSAQKSVSAEKIAKGLHEAIIYGLQTSPYKEGGTLLIVARQLRRNKSDFISNIGYHLEMEIRP